jgi:hypothetical protein
MNQNFLPVARKENLVVQELSEELLVYDLRRNKALCLNQTAKLILEQCDGKTTFREAAEHIKGKTKAEISDEIFWVALEQLKKNNLLNESQMLAEIPKVSRRDLMRSGLALSLALPLITSLVAPSAVQAQSGACTPAGDICSVDLNGMDNCCPQLSCTMQVSGFCCIIANIPLSCDPLNDLCCPNTFCDSQTNICVPNIP